MTQSVKFEREREREREIAESFEKREKGIYTHSTTRTWETCTKSAGVAEGGSRRHNQENPREGQWSGISCARAQFAFSPDHHAEQDDQVNVEEEAPDTHDRGRARATTNVTRVSTRVFLSCRARPSKVVREKEGEKQNLSDWKEKKRERQTELGTAVVRETPPLSNANTQVDNSTILPAGGPKRARCALCAVLDDLTMTRARWRPTDVYRYIRDLVLFHIHTVVCL